MAIESHPWFPYDNAHWLGAQITTGDLVSTTSGMERGCTYILLEARCLMDAEGYLCSPFSIRHQKG
jgi:hypothetical protein